MSARGTIKALLEADATLLATATGGVWDFDETGRLGISRETTAAAYSVAGIIKPCVLVKGRGARADGAINDDVAQIVSTREIVEIWFYQDIGYTTIRTMKARVYALLHGKRITGTFAVNWVGEIFTDMRDNEMGNISVERDDYQVVALKRP